MELEDFNEKLEDRELIVCMDREIERQKSENPYCDCLLIDDYKREGRISGSVYKAQHKVTGEFVALKKLPAESGNDVRGISFPMTSLRVLKSMQRIQHENIVRLIGVAVGHSLTSVFLVTEYCDKDFKNIIDNLIIPFGPPEVKNIIGQLLTGMSMLHRYFIMHRDIKPASLLIDASGTLKISDFASSRSNSFRPLTPAIGTLCYRAPEILFQLYKYAFPVDVWSAACVCGELIRRSPLFPGETELEVISSIIDLLGTPTERIMPGFSQCPVFKACELKEQPHNLVRKCFKNVPQSLVDLLKNMLCFNQELRPTALNCLSFEYMKEEPSPCDNSTLRYNIEWKTQNLHEDSETED